MTENKQIYTKITKHRSKLCVQLLYRYYPKNVTDKQVRKLNNVKWSKTMNCWYINYRNDYAKHLLNKLKLPILDAEKNTSIVNEIIKYNKFERLERFSQYKKKNDLKYAKETTEKSRIKQKKSIKGETALLLINKINNKIQLTLSDDSEIKTELTKIDSNFRLEKYSKWIFAGTNDNYLAILRILKRHNYYITKQYQKNIDELQDNPIIKHYVQTMQMRNNSRNTINAYLPYFKDFVLYFKNENISKLEYNEINTFVQSQISRKNLSSLQEKHLISAIKYYYEKIQGRSKLFFYLRNTVKTIKYRLEIPVNEILEILASVEELKEKLIIILYYSFPLNFEQISELTLIEIKIILRNKFKNNPEARKIILLYLTEYYRDLLPKKYLFEIKPYKNYTSEQIKFEFLTAISNNKLVDIYKKEFIEICRKAELAVSTTENYLSFFISFLKNFNFVHPLTITNEQIRIFILKLNKKSYSKNTINQYINVIKLFYEKANKRKFLSKYIFRPKRGEKLPIVLSEEELTSIFSKIKNLKHKALMLITFSGGLRRNETLSLQVNDIDFNRNDILINGKGNKQRTALLSETLKPILLEYIKIYKPSDYLFEGATGGKYSFTSFSRILSEAVSKAGIKKRVTLHTLRHTFATNLLEQGVDIRIIQELLGHKDIKTTLRYTHVAKKQLRKIVSPLDNINLTIGKGDFRQPP